MKEIAWRSISTVDFNFNAIAALNFDLEDNGVVFDGATDNSDRLIALRDMALARQANVPTLTTKYIGAASGTCQYSNNRWCYGLNAVEIENGTYQCSSTSVWGRDRGFIYLPALDETISFDPPFSSPGSRLGDLIDAVSAGATSVTLQDVNDAANHIVGSAAFVYGYDQQFTGFPPNPRFYDLVTITAVSEGIVTFTPALQHSYQTTWPEGSDCGPARLLTLDRPTVRANRSLSFDAISVLNNAIDGYENNEFHSLSLSMTDCTVEGEIAFSFAKTTTITDCTADRVEVDKWLGVATFSGGQYGEMTAATGCESLTLTDGLVFEPDVRAEVLRVEAKTVILDNITVNTDDDVSSVEPMRLLNFATIDTSLIVRNTDFVSTKATPRPAILLGSVLSITVEGVGAGDEIIISDETERENAFRRLFVGQTIWLSTTGASGVITDLYADGDDWIIEGDWGVTPAISQVWELFSIKDWDIEATNTFTGFSRDLTHPFRPIPGEDGQSLEVSSDVLAATGSTEYEMRGFPSALAITVNSTGTGVATFTFTEGDDITDHVVVIDASTTGTRTINSGGVSGGQPGDTLGNTFVGQYIKTVTISVATAAVDADGTLTADGV